MQIRDIMTPDPDLIDPNSTIQEAARMMKNDNVGAIPVGENDRLIGMITDRDIAIRAVADNRNPSTTTVREAMSEKILYCFDDDAIDDAAQCMSDHQVRRLPVLNRDKRLVGILALADLARTGKKADKTALEGISEPSSKSRRMTVEIV